ARAEHGDQRQALEARYRALELPTAPVVTAQARVERPRRVQPPPFLVRRARERALECRDLFRREALARVVRAARELVDVERLLARRERTDDTVLRAVECVALREHGVRDDLHVVARERVLGVVGCLLEALD